MIWVDESRVREDGLRIQAGSLLIFVEAIEQLAEPVRHHTLAMQVQWQCLASGSGKNCGKSERN